jgi:hypothetical protein
MAAWRCVYSKAMDNALGRNVKDMSSDEQDALPPNYTPASHLTHALYDGLSALKDDMNQLRHFCDMVTQLVFPNTPLDILYKSLDPGAGATSRSYAFELPEREEDHIELDPWILERTEHIMRWGRPKEWDWAVLTEDWSDFMEESENEDKLIEDD